MANLSVVSYNCRGFNVSKLPCINKILLNCDILLLQETWLCRKQKLFAWVKLNCFLVAPRVSILYKRELINATINSDRI